VNFPADTRSRPAPDESPDDAGSSVAMEMAAFGMMASSSGHDDAWDEPPSISAPFCHFGESRAKHMLGETGHCPFPAREPSSRMLEANAQLREAPRVAADFGPPIQFPDLCRKMFGICRRSRTTRNVSLITRARSYRSPHFNFVRRTSK
jgi:hypothetical protein